MTPRPLAELERIGELIRLMDEIDNLDTEHWDTIEVRKIRYVSRSSHVVSDSRSIFEFDCDDTRIIRAALEAALKEEQK